MDSETPKVLASAADLSKKLVADLDEMVVLANKLKTDLAAVAPLLDFEHKASLGREPLAPADRAVERGQPEARVPEEPVRHHKK